MQVTEITVSTKRSWGRGENGGKQKTWDGGEIIFSSTASLGPTEDPVLCRANLYNIQKNQIAENMKKNGVVVK